MVKIHVERTIAASPERVFSWLADPANLTAAPLVLSAGWAKKSPAPASAHCAKLRPPVCGFERKSLRTTPHGDTRIGSFGPSRPLTMKAAA